MSSSKPKLRILKAVSVPKSETLEEGYTVFTIEAVTNTGTVIVKRRYTEFLSLHRTLRENGEIISLEFPSKHVLKKKTPQLIDQRRKDLQEYIKHVFTIRKAQKYLYAFLGILNSVKLLSQSPREMRLFNFNPCCQVEPHYLEEEATYKTMDSDVPSTRTYVTNDIVVSGVLTALGHHSVTQYVK